MVRSHTKRTTHWYPDGHIKVIAIKHNFIQLLQIYWSKTTSTVSKDTINHSDFWLAHLRTQKKRQFLGEKMCKECIESKQTLIFNFWGIVKYWGKSLKSSLWSNIIRIYPTWLNQAHHYTFFTQATIRRKLSMFWLNDSNHWIMKSFISSLYIIHKNL